VRPVNLIPPEDRRGDHAPLRAGPTSYAIVAVLAVALIGAVLVVLTGNQISDSKTQIAELEVRKAQAEVSAAGLAPYEQFASLEQARSETVSSLAQSRFDWERVLNELALVVPRRVTLENLTGTAGVGVSVSSDTAAASTDVSITGPSLQITGCAEGQKGTARLLAALKDIDGVTRVGMQSSELGDETAAAAATSSTDSGGGDAPTTSCQTKPSVAHFQITVAFDAVPVPPTATPPTATAPATAPATTTTTTETTASDPAVADGQAEQQASVDAATDQVSQAKDEASTVGVGGG
jgi:Tfp pilus assembly protein PilN